MRIIYFYPYYKRLKGLYLLLLYLISYSTGVELRNRDKLNPLRPHCDAMWCLKNQILQACLFDVFHYDTAHCKPCGVTTV